MHQPGECFALGSRARGRTSILAPLISSLKASGVSIVAVFLLSIGSGFWGAIADRVGIDFALTYAALGLALGLAVIPFHSLRVTPVREVTMAPQQ